MMLAVLHYFVFVAGLVVGGALILDTYARWRYKREQSRRNKS